MLGWKISILDDNMLNLGTTNEIIYVLIWLGLGLKVDIHP